MSRSARTSPAAALTICLALLTAACADRAPTAPADAPSFARGVPPAAGGNKPTQFDVPDASLTWAAPAGVVCSFAVSSEVLVNQLVTKRFPADKNGDILELTTGVAVARYTNLATRRSITVNISGPGQFTIHADGSATLVAVGRWTHVFPEGVELAGGLTFFLTAGRVVMEISASGVGELVSREGRVEDLCAALS
ncbi:MAG: hypothetical protein ACXWZ7_17540 [Gemmatirosa sp.]